MNFAAIVFVGPGELEKLRLTDLLESLFHYEPNVALVVIIDDRSGSDWQRELTVPQSCQLVVLPNPRNGKGDWWKGGLCTGLTTALRWLGLNAKIDFAVRLDTDALVIGPFAARTKELFDEQHNVGLVGTFRHRPNGERIQRNDVGWLRVVVPKLCRSVAVWRHSSHWPRLQCTLHPQHRMVARAARTALQNGYQPGEFIQGGGYAISGEVIARSLAAGFIANPLGYLPMYFSEDHLATLLCYAAGKVPLDFNRQGQPYGVVYKGLCAEPQQLVERGYGVIHSVKTEDPTAELAIREFFRALRQPAQIAK